MIQNKNQLKNKLKENKDNIIIKRIYNFDKNNKIAEGSTATIEQVKTNSFTIKYDCNGREVWIYYDNIEVKDNKIIYYDYIPDYKKEEAEEKAKTLNIELLEVSPDDKINKNNSSNYKYIYKYIIMINEIIEK
jgi:hypothetical protein